MPAAGLRLLITDSHSLKEREMKHMASSMPAGKSFLSARSCVLPYPTLLYSLQKLSDFKVHVHIKKNAAAIKHCRRHFAMAWYSNTFIKQERHNFKGTFHMQYRLCLMKFISVARNLHSHFNLVMITWLKYSHTVALIDTGAVNVMRALFLSMSMFAGADSLMHW